VENLVRKRFKSQSISQLQKHIRATSKNTDLVFVLQHTKDQMKIRKVLIDEVFECLQQGVIHMQPEEDIKTGHLICRMKRYVCGRNLAVCVGLDDDDPSLLVITVFVVTKRGK